MRQVWRYIRGTKITSWCDLTRTSMNVALWLDLFSRNFDEGVSIQTKLPKQQIDIISIKEDINTSDDRTAAKYFRRMIPRKGPHRVDATSERMKQCK